MLGSYAGDLIVLEEIGNHSIVAISSTNKSLSFLAQFPAEAPERVFPVTLSEDLYLGKYDQGVIMKFPASDFSSISPSSLLVVTEGENGQNGSINILNARGSNVSTTRILLENGTHFEGMAYAPSNLNSSSAGSSITGNVTNSSANSGALSNIVLLPITFVLLISVTSVLVLRSRKVTS